MTLRVPNPQSAVEVRRAFQQLPLYYLRTSALNGAKSGTITRDSDNLISTLTLVYERDGTDETVVYTFTYTDLILSQIVKVDGASVTTTYAFTHDSDNFLTSFTAT